MSATPASSAADAAERDARAALDGGDLRAALDVLMRAYGNAIYRFCRQMVADGAMADDVHQTTFAQAYEGLGRFAGRSTFRSWLFSIARHRCLDALKLARRRQARFEAVADLPENPASDPGAEERLAARAHRRALRRCLGQLRPTVRTAVLLRYQEDLSYPEMARACGVRAPTLQARVARALPVLRRCLEGQEAVP